MRTVLPLLALVLLAGCGVQSTDTIEADASPKKEAAPVPDTVQAEDGQTLAVFKNEKGELACPVMKSPIASIDAAFSHTDYEGKRYYFCCDGCPTVFDKNKDEYAK